MTLGEHLISTVLQLVALVAGSCMLYVAGLLFPSERDKFHHWLETVWIRADDLQKLGMRKQAAIARGTVEAATRLLERAFGKSLLSFRALSSAAFLSVASFIFWMILSSALPWVQVNWNGWLAGLVAVALLYCAIGREPELRVAYALAGWGLSFFAASWLLGPIIVQGSAERIAGLVGVLGLGAICDLLFIAFMRWTLRKAGGLESIVSIALIAVMNLAVAAILFMGPEFLGVEAGDAAAGGDPSWWQTVAYLVPITNTLDVVLSLCLFGLWALVIVNRLLWPILNRALHAIADERLLRHRGRLALAGLLLIAVGIPGLRPLVGRILRALSPF